MFQTTNQKMNVNGWTPTAGAHPRKHRAAVQGRRGTLSESSCELFQVHVLQNLKTVPSGDLMVI